MEDEKWERWSALGGILFVVLVMAAALMPGSPAKPTDSAAKILKYVDDNGDALRWAGYLSALAVLPFLWWMGAVWRMLRRAEGGSPRLAVLAIGGAFTSVSASVIGAVVISAVEIYGPERLGAQPVKFFYILSGVISASALFGIAVLIGSISAAALRTAVLPRALGGFGAIVALVAVLGGTAVASTRDAFMALGLVAYMGASIFVVVASVLMLRSIREPQVAAVSG